MRPSASRLTVVAAAVLGAAACGPAPDPAGPGALSGWNVLLVTIDTLRADRLGFSGHAAADTPVLDSLAAGGVVFENAVASAPVTLPSHATLLTGRYPPAHGALDNGFYSLPDDVPTLAGALRDAGYQTGAVVGAFVLHRNYGLDRGFDSYDDRFRNPRLPGQEHVERRAGEVVASARSWLSARDRDRPFFLWVHCFDPHSPYDPPEPYRGRFADPYDGEIAYTDAQIGGLMEVMRRDGLDRRTLVIVVSDHGEAFGDGGEQTHGFLLRRSTLHVPLVMAAPDVLPAGRRVAGTVSTADLAPTVTELLGVAALPGADGASLLPAIAAGRAEGRSAYSETRLPADMLGWAMLAGVRDDEWAYVRAPRPELYRAADDPREEANLHDEHPEAAGERDRIVETVLRNAHGSGGADVISPEEAEALNALGYAAGTQRREAGGADPKDMLPLWRRVEDAHGALAAGEADAAESLVRGVLAEDPGNPEARLTLAQALIAQGRTGEAEPVLRKELDRDPGRAGTMLADALARSGRWEEAEAVYRDLMAREPGFAEHPFNLGVLLWHLGRGSEAIAAYETALRLNPDAVHVLANYAQALSTAPRDVTDADRAVRALDRAIALSPDDDRPRLLQVFLYLQLGRRDDAVRAAETLARKQPLRGVAPQEVQNALRRAREG